MTLADRALRWLYLLAAGLTGHCSVTSARADAWWYAIGLFCVSLLLVVAVAREHVAADAQKRARADADRAARLHERRRHQPAPLIVGQACCELWWTSTGTAHEHTCTNYGTQRRTA